MKKPLNNCFSSALLQDPAAAGELGQRQHHSGGMCQHRGTSGPSRSTTNKGLGKAKLSHAGGGSRQQTSVQQVRRYQILAAYMAADIAVGSGRMAQTGFEVVAYGRAWRWRHGWARRGSGTTGSDRAHEQASVKAMQWGTVAMGEGMAPVKIWAA